MKLTAIEAMCLCARLVAVSHVLAMIEMLWRDGVLRSDGMMSWTVMRVRARRYVDPRWAGLLNWLYDYPNVRWLVGARLLVSAIMLAAPDRWLIFPILLPLLASITLIYEFRSDYGSDGSDQMTVIVTLSLAVATILPQTRVIALGFLAFQACLAYGVAGWAKAFRKEWWNGRYAIGVSKTQTFGTPVFGEFLGRHQPLAAALSSGMLVWEMGFPLILVLPMPAAMVVLAIGVGFHVFNALHMGLNTFVWAFSATYPPLLFVLGLRGY